MHKYRGIELSTQQSKPVDKALAEESLIIQGPAGSGKTLSLLVFTRKTNGKGFNITFSKNSTIAASKKFPKNSTTCKTGHSIAFGKEGYKYKERLGQVTGRQVAKLISLGHPGIYNTENNKAYQMIETIRHFCYSADEEILPHHVPTPISTATPYVIEESKKELAEYSKQLWQMMTNTHHSVLITPDVYLKVWALTKPNLNKDFIVYDESQDINMVFLAVLMNQLNTQIIFAGDRFQQIYAWRGAVNAMTRVKFKTYEISKSFRFGQPIADIANRIINSYSDPINHIKPIIGTDKECEIVTEKRGIIPNCIICRTNAGLVSETIKTLSHKFKVFILGGPQPLISLIEGIEALKKGRKTYHHELRLFQNYDEFVEYAESPQGGGLKAILNIIKKHSFEDLLSYLYQTQEKPTPDAITITTTHKAKGLEWPIVKLSNDFKFPLDNISIITQEEVNILYVASTRAQEKLLIYDCQALDESSLRNGKDYWDIMKTNKGEELL